MGLQVLKKEEMFGFEQWCPHRYEQLMIKQNYLLFQITLGLNTCIQLHNFQLDKFFQVHCNYS